MGLLRTTISPHNQGRAKFVQQELDWSISRANSQLVEALKVDGIELQYWKKVEEGNYCHCGFGLSHPMNPIHNASNTQINNNQIESPPLANVPESLAPATVTITNAWGEQEIKPDNPDKNVLGIPPVNDATQTNAQFKTDTIQNTPQATGEDEDFFAAPDGYDLLTGMERTQCGICLGAGKTNAWGLLGGRREVFEYYTVGNISKFAIKTDTRPVSFQAPRDTNAYAEWTYTLPTYYKTCLNYSVRNNTQAVRDLKLFYKIQGSNDPFQRMTIDFLNSRNGTPTTLILRVQPIVTGLSGTLEFTHFEIIWQLADFPIAQMDKLTTATNQQIRDTIVSSSFTMPPSIEQITKNDIFFENKYNKMWQISDFSDNLTSRREVFGWNVSARNIQPYEQKSLLQITHERYYQVAYDGLNPFQQPFLRT